MADPGNPPASFQTLPQEITTEIWRFVCTEPRQITVSYFSYGPDSIGLRFVTKTPPMFQVSPDARQQGFLHYERFLPDGQSITMFGVYNDFGSNTYLNKSGIDLLYITSGKPGIDEEAGRKHCQLALLGLFALGKREGQPSLFRHLALDFDHLSPLFQNWEHRYNYPMIEWIRNRDISRNIEDIVFVVNKRNTQHNKIESLDLQSPSSATVRVYITVLSRGDRADDSDDLDLSSSNEPIRDLTRFDEAYQFFSREGETHVTMLLSNLPRNFKFGCGFGLKQKLRRSAPSAILEADLPALPWCIAMCCGEEVIITARCILYDHALRLTMEVSLENMWNTIGREVASFSVERGSEPYKTLSLSLGEWV